MAQSLDVLEVTRRKTRWKWCDPSLKMWRWRVSVNVSLGIGL